MNRRGLKWKLGELLEREGVTVYALNRDLLEHKQGVSRTTLYRLASEQPEKIDLKVTARILAGLERLTGKQYEVWDLLERIPDLPVDEEESAQDDLLQSDVVDLAEAMQELERDIPSEQHRRWLESFGLTR